MANLFVQVLDKDICEVHMQLSSNHFAFDSDSLFTRMGQDTNLEVRNIMCMCFKCAQIEL